MAQKSQPIQDDSFELLFRLNQKAKDRRHYDAMWTGEAALKTPQGFSFEDDEIGLRTHEEAINISTSHRQGKALLTPEPMTDASSLLMDLGKSGLALVDQTLYLQEDISTDGLGIKSLKLIARYTLRSKNNLHEDELELDTDDVRRWVNNLFVLTEPFLWQVSIFRNPTSDERCKTHISFRGRSDRPKAQPDSVRMAPHVLRLEGGQFMLKTA